LLSVSTNDYEVSFLALLLIICGFGLAQTKTETELPIVAGRGWGDVNVGAKRQSVERVLGTGEGDEGSKYLDGVYFREYPQHGIQVSFTHKEDKVVAIFFYNKQHRYENLATASVKTDKGIDRSASPDQVKKAYGKPKENYSGTGWRRMVFEGIDFRWENGVMVRIGIPGH
jgi:hypothetical protein